MLIGMWGVPARNSLFTGRENQLKALYDKFFEERSTSKSPRSAFVESLGSQRNSGIKRTELRGIGGVGKTQLSVEYCHRHFGSKYGFVVMIRAESQASIAQDMRRLASDLGILGNDSSSNKNSNSSSNSDDSGGKSALSKELLSKQSSNRGHTQPNSASQNGFRDSNSNIDSGRLGDTGQSNVKTLSGDIDDDEVMEIIKRKLSRCRFRWLMVFDNVEDFSVISKYLPRGQLNDHFTPMSSAASAVFASATAAAAVTATPLRYTVDRELDLESSNPSSTVEGQQNSDVDSMSWINSVDNTESQGGGHVIITSRTSHSSSNTYSNNYSIHNGVNVCDSTHMRHSPSVSIVLECFDKSESLRFLDSSLLQSATDSTTLSITSTSQVVTTTSSSSSSVEARSLSALADRMGHLPLALAMASAYLTRCDVTASEYLKRLDKLIIYEEYINDSEEGSDEDYEDDSDDKHKSDTDESQGTRCRQGTENDSIEDSKFDCSNERENAAEEDRKKKEDGSVLGRRLRRRGREVDIVGANDYSVVSSLSISLDRILAESQAAYTVLLLLGFLSPDGITKVLVRRLLEIGYFCTETDIKSALSTSTRTSGASRNTSYQNLSAAVLGLVDLPSTEGQCGSVHDSSQSSTDGTLLSHSNLHSLTLSADARARKVKIDVGEATTCRIASSKVQVHAPMSYDYTVISYLASILIVFLTVSFLPLPSIEILSLTLEGMVGVLLLSCYALYGVKRFVDDVIMYTLTGLNSAFDKIGIVDVQKNQKHLEESSSHTDNEGVEVMALMGEFDYVNGSIDVGSRLITAQTQLIESKHTFAPHYLQNSENQNLNTNQNQNQKQPQPQVQVQSEENVLRETDRVWELLKQFSLLSVRGGRGNRVGSIHRLQQSVLRSRIFKIGGAKNAKNQLGKCVYAINCMWQFNIKDSDTWEECGSLLNHIQSLVGHVRQYPLSADVARRFAVILTQAASYSTEVLSRFDYAQHLLESAVLIQGKIIAADKSETSEKATGDDNQDRTALFELLDEKADVMHLLGKVLRIRGDYSKAERSLETALIMRKRTKSRKICDTYHELGVLSLRHHEYSIAFQYLTDSLVLKRSLRKEHQLSQHAIDDLKHQSQSLSGNGSRGKASEMIMTETSEAATLHQLAVIATGEGSYEDAELLLLEALMLESTAESGLQLDGAEGEGERIEEEEEEGDDRSNSAIDLDAITEFEKTDVIEGGGTQEAPTVTIAVHGDEKVAIDADSTQHKKKKYIKSRCTDSNKSIIMNQKRLSTLRKIATIKVKLAALQNAGSKVRGTGNDLRKPRISVSRAATLQQLGRVALRTGRLSEAETRFRDSLSLYHAAYGAEKFSRHINVAAVYHQLGCCLSAMHDFSEASKHFSLALATREMIYGNSLYGSTENNFLYLDNDTDDNNNNSTDYNGMSQCKTSDCGSIEIIQEIQALGQSELMVGKLKSAQKLFLRQFDMCLKSLNLRVVTENNEMVIQIDSHSDGMDNNNDMNVVGSSVGNTSSSSNSKGSNLTVSVGDYGVSRNAAVILSLPPPLFLPSSSSSSLLLPELLSSATSLRRKQDSLIRFLLFSVYSLKSICNREKKSCAAADYARLARVVRRMLLQGKNNNDNFQASDDTKSIRDDSTSNRTNSGTTDSSTVCILSIDNPDQKIEGDLHQANSDDNPQKKSSNQAVVSNEVSSCLLAPKLLKSRDDVRALTIQLSKGKCSPTAIESKISDLQCLELCLRSAPCSTENRGTFLNDDSTVHRDIAPYNMDEVLLNDNRLDIEALQNSNSGSQGDWDNYVLVIGLKYAISCRVNLALIMKMMTSQTVSPCNKLAGAVATSTDKGFQSQISSLFVSCDTLRLQLRNSGLHIEDSRT